MAQCIKASVSASAVAPVASASRSAPRRSAMAAKLASGRALAGNSMRSASQVSYSRKAASRGMVSVQASVGKGRGDLEMVTLKDGKDHAEVYTFGGVCTSFAKDGVDVLYVRPDAKFDKSKPISGGIPHCWPQFGPGKMQLHGFARNMQWKLTSSTDSSCTMTLTSCAETKKMWPYDFKVTQTITLKNGALEATMEVHNTDTMAFEFTGSFHTYFACKNISDVTVAGLGGLKTVNRLTQTESLASGTLSIDGPIDSVYYGAKTNPLTLGVGDGRMVSIGYQGWPDVVVWNPWTEMKDCYEKFVCVENAACNPVKVAPGSSWKGSMMLACNAVDPMDQFCASAPDADECRVYTD